VIAAHVAYASRLYHIPEHFDGDWHCAYVQAAPPPTALFHPTVLFRVLLQVVRSSFDSKRQSHENTNRNHSRNRQVGSSQAA
jgi:hypothetical protein